MSVGSHSRLTPVEGFVAGQRTRGSARNSMRMNARGLGVVTPPATNRIAKYKTQLLSVSARRDMARDGFQWRIEPRVHKARALAPPTGRQEVSDEFPDPR